MAIRQMDDEHGIACRQKVGEVKDDERVMYFLASLHLSKKESR